MHCNNPSSTSDQITMKGVLIPQVKTHKHLGLTINNALKWTDHINNTYTTCVRQVGILRRLRKKLDPSVIKRIYTAALRPKMEYACGIWSGGTTTKLVELQKTFCRRHNIDLSPLQQRFLYISLILLFKIHLNLTPKYLSEFLPAHSSTSGYGFRK